MLKEAKIYLKKGKEESLKRFHPWIFSGAIARVEGVAVDGEIVGVYSHEGAFLAKGHCGMGSIAVRVLTFKDEVLDEGWWKRRITEAYRMREILGLTASSETNCYRLIHGEGDALPGLVVDIYGNTAVFQAHSVGMYLERDVICKTIKAIYGSRITAVYDKSSATLPYNEEITVTDGYLFKKDNHSALQVRENGILFDVNWVEGQKTGFFIDQRVNRNLVKYYSQGRTVLNTFCYTGGFSVYALAGGAVSVDSVDSSGKAVELCEKNVSLNFPENDSHRGITEDAFQFLRDMESDKYDLIILDPPAFAKHHKARENALQGYKRINVQAFRKIRAGGILFTFSCSQAISKEQFRMAVFSAAAIAGRNVRILHQLTQPADHPVNIYHPEGEYLKGLVLYVE